MDNNKLHLIACHAASFMVERALGDAKIALDRNDVSIALKPAAIKYGLECANIPLAKTSDVIEEVSKNDYFRGIFMIQLNMLIKNTRLYD